MATRQAHQLTVPISAGDHVQGVLTAPMTLLEYGDYECPYCGLAYWVVKDVQRRLGDDLAFAFRNFPLTNVHPHALRAAQAAEAAGWQGKFWPMHDRLYEHQDQLDDPMLVSHAAAVGVDIQRFVADLVENRHLDRIREDIASGARSGVNGTPTFFVNGIRHEGVYDADTLTHALETTA